MKIAVGCPFVKSGQGKGRFPNFALPITISGKQAKGVAHHIDVGLGFLGHKPVNPRVVILHSRFIPAVNK